MLNEVRELVKRYKGIMTPCGSRVTCDPPPDDTDEDYLIYICDGAPNGGISELVALLAGLCFKWEGSSEHYLNVASSDFMSWRLDDINLIVTSNELFHERHMLATYVCTKLNLMDKNHRITLFQAILYGEYWAPVKKKEGT